MAGAAGRAIGDLWEGKLSSFGDYAKATAEGALVGAAVGSGGAALGATAGGAIAVGGALVEGRVPTVGEVIAGAAGGAFAGIGLPIGGKAVATGAKGAAAGAALKGEVTQATKASPQIGAAVEGAIASKNVGATTNEMGNVINVTKSGATLPAEGKYHIPDIFPQNAHRSGSYVEIIDSIFKEILRVDPATPAEKKGKNY